MNGDDTSRLLSELLASVKSLEARVAALERAMPADIGPAESPPPLPVSVTASPPRETPAAVSSEAVPAPAVQADSPPAPVPGAQVNVPYPPPPAAAPAPPKAGMEGRVGVLLSRIGAVLVFLGVAFFLKIAMDHIGDVGKVAIGIVSGMTLLGGGELAQRKSYNAFARALTGGGLAVLYLSVFAAFSFFDLIGQAPAFAIMALITAAGVTLSVRYNSQVIVVLAMIGGYLTPVLLSTHRDAQVALMSYIIILDVGLLGLAYWRRWRVVALLCFLATWGIQLGWMLAFFSTHKFAPTFFFATVFFLIFAAIHVLHSLINRIKAGPEDLVLVTLNAAAYFFFGYGLLSDLGYEKALGGFSLALALVYLLQVRLSMRLNPEDSNLHRFMVGLCVAFLTVAIPLQLEYESVTIAWAAEALALTAFGLWSKNQFIRYLGVIVLAAAVGHLFSMDTELFHDKAIHQGKFGPILFAVIVTYGSTLAALQGTLFCYKKLGDPAETPNWLKPLLHLASSVVLLVGIMIANHYMFETDANPDFFYGSSRRAESLSVSLILGLYASAMIFLGILYRFKWLRYFGLGILAIALFKVVFVDMARLALTLRVASFLVLGILLIGLSFLYQKYKDRIEGIAFAEEETSSQAPASEALPPQPEDKVEENGNED